MRRGGGEEHREGRQRADPVPVEARVGVRVGAPGRPPRPPGRQELGIPREHDRPRQEPLEQFARHVVAAERHECLALGVEEVGADHVRATRAGDLARHLAQALDGGAGAREDLADGQERRGLAQPLLGLGVEPRVLERQRELPRDRHREVHLPRLERRRPFAVVERHDADHLLLPEHGHDEIGLEAERLDPLPRHPRILRRVVHDDGPARVAGEHVRRHVEDGARHRRLEGGPLPRRPPSVGELRHERPYPPVLPQHQRTAVHAAHLCDLHRRALEEALGVERRAQDLDHLEERARLLEAPLRRAVEPRVVEGDGRLRRERPEERRGLGRDRRRRRAVDGERAQDALAERDRVPGDEAETLPGQIRAVDDARIRLDVHPEHRLAMERDPAERALPERQLRAQLRGGLGRAVHERARQAAGRLVEHPHGHGGRVEEPRHRRGDVVQHLLHLERRGDEAVHLLQGGEAVGVLARLVVEPGVLEGQRRLVGERLGEAGLRLVEAAPRAVADDEGAEQSVLAEQRDGEQRAVRLARHPGAHVLGVGDPRIGEGVVGGDGPALADREPGDPGPRRERWAPVE